MADLSPAKRMRTIGGASSPPPPIIKPGETPRYEHYCLIADHLKNKTKFRPSLLIICGSGLGKLAELVTEQQVIPYKDIPGFPLSTVQGHKGQLVFGNLEGKVVACMQGRFHSYEGYKMWELALPIRVMKLMGVSMMIATNACGALNSAYSIGDIMVMDDHINFTGMSGRHPLVGPNVDEFGPRFNSMTHAYNRGFVHLAETVSTELEMGSFMQKGVYVCLSGPSYETPAECRMLEKMGADVVGMSTAPEVTVGVHCGMRCLGFSLVTNKAIMDVESTDAPNHEEVVEAANARMLDMNKLVSTIVRRME